MVSQNFTNLRTVLRLSCLVLGALLFSQASAALRTTHLTCENMREALGVDTPEPRLSWRVESSGHGQRQTAYQIVAASSPKLLFREPDLWDTGKVASDETVNVPYYGRTLKSTQRVWWAVRAWDQDGARGRWSEPALFITGVIKPADWRAQWISSAEALVPARLLIGYHAKETREEFEPKWVQFDLGQSLPLEAVRLHPKVHAGKAGFGFPLRFKIELADDPEFQNPWMLADHTGADYESPKARPVRFDAQGAQARFVRITATKLWKRDWAYCFALSQVEIRSGGTNVAPAAQVTAKDSVEAHGWGLTAISDAMGFNDGAPRPASVQSLLLRREFEVKPGLKHATIHVCGLAQYEVSLNGRKAGTDLITPGWTKYNKTCLYDTYDITPLLRSGHNAAGIILGNGMYHVPGGRYTKFRGSFGPLKTIAQLTLEYQDGSVDIIGTDTGWKVAPGPLTFSCVYGGEDYDARLEPKGWDRTGFADSTWKEAVEVPSPGGTLRGLTCAAPPIRAFDVLDPVKVNPLKPGVVVYDLGQNASVMPQLTVSGLAGSIVRITPAELLKEDGTVDRGSVGGGVAYWQYTLAGEGREHWFPKFFYQGSRYWQVELLPGSAEKAPEILELQGVVVHTSAEPVGEFACSSDLFNRIRRLVRWAQRSNLMSVVTDCPHREKLGWLEQYHLNGPSLRYEFNLNQLFTKGMNDMADSQLDSGLVPDIAPEYVVFDGGFRDSPEWGSAVVLVPWQQYLFTGDTELLRRYYEPMKRYVAYLGTTASNNIVSHGLGDWYDIGPKPPGYAQLTPIPLTATAFYYYDAFVLSEAARLLGKTEDQKHFRELAAAIRTSFNQKFYDPNAQSYASGAQAANAIPLVMGLAEPANRPAVLEAIVRDVRQRGNALTAGDVGYRYLLRALAEGGRSDVIFDMNHQSEKPGYGYQLKQGATSLTEAWDARRASSHNHFMLGQIMEWFYHDLAGIQPNPARPGFKHVILKPEPAGDITWVKASYESARGPIRSEWKREGDRFTLKVSVPANTTATVHLPGKAANIKPAKIARKATQDHDAYEIGSGEWEFEAGIGGR